MSKMMMRPPVLVVVSAVRHRPHVPRRHYHARHPRSHTLLAATVVVVVADVL